jgi:hypothetical protein
MAQTKREPKPKISAEAKDRIRAFVSDVLAAQLRHGVELYCEVDSFGLRDARRTKAWICDGQVYGDYDAFIWDGNVSGFTEENLSIEDFKGWGK